MKKQSLTIRLMAASMLICILCLIGCYQFDFVNQPFSAEPGNSFEVEISVTMRPGTGAGYAIPYFGILLPTGWTVNDSIVFSYENTLGLLVYSDSLTQLMYGIEPVPLFYHWWVAQGLTEVYHEVNMTYGFSPVINTTDQPGMFFLDYMVGDNENGLNRERSNDHLITVGLPGNVTVTNSNDSGPGSLRAAIDAVDFYGSICFSLDPCDTIFLQDQLTIYKDVQISGTEENPVVISGNEQHRVYTITEGRSPALVNLHIVRGQADTGGGIYCMRNSSLTLENVTISDNSAGKGGGIYCDYGASVIFDCIHRSDIHQNSASWGNDIYSETPVELYLDTFTVLYPTEYHLFPRENFLCDILYGKFQQADADLFVSPDGDNSNSGLTIDDPLQTIDFAFCIIRADSLHQNAIHLLNGVYSPSSNNEKFPVIVPDFIGLNGESETGVVLNGNGISKVLIVDQNSSSDISGLTITGGTGELGGGLSCLSSIADFDHVTIRDNPCCGMYISGSELTFTHGKITHNNHTGSGGGIRCSGSHLLLNDVVISNNCSGSSGGGIDFSSSSPVLENVTISHNSAEYGGGIHCKSSNIVFDSIKRCNIYLNNASYGNDLRFYTATQVILDTFSVLYPTDFYVDPLENCSFDILNGKVQQADADLYVSPYGDDANDGLTEDDPLKTIRHAMSRIVADSTHTNTIRLLEGTYGPSANQEVMPLRIPSYFSISGTLADEVILDAEGQSRVIVIESDKRAAVSGVTITGGNDEYGGGISCLGRLTLQNAVIAGNTASHGGGIDFGGFGVYSATALLRNVLLSGNSAADRGGGIYCSESSVTLQNVTMTNNEGSRGGGLYCQHGSAVTIHNSIISGNTGGNIYFLGFNPWNYVWSHWSNVNGGIYTNGNGTYQTFGGCLSEDPVFAGTGDHPYSISQDSPCIDAGNPDTLGLNMLQHDIMGNCRVWDGDGNDTATIDMGAYEFGSLPVGISDSRLQVTEYGLRVEVWPNPADRIVDCQLHGLRAEPEGSIVDFQSISMKIFDLYGREIRMLLEEAKPPGEYSVRIDVSDLPAGVYLVRLQAGGQKAVKKLIVR